MARKSSPAPGKSGFSVSIRFLVAVGAAVLAALWLWPNGVVSEDGRGVTYLEQGWDAQMREAFYYTPQGSRLMPYTWFLALEQADSDKAFADPDNLAGFGYLMATMKDSALNPDGLPVGFVRGEFDESGLGHWLGLTCAACHTNDLTYRGQTIRIDGAPTLADFNVFLGALTGAVAATRLNPEKFARFAANVLGDQSDPREMQQLLGAFNAYAVTLEGETWMRTPPLPAGPGRTDALGQIINALSVFDLHEPDNLRPTSAPVSYPFLWYTPRLEWVQWVPIANNPIARNGGEALGVFGRANLTGGADELFTSSALFSNLFALEQWVDDLRPPPWPEDIFGPLNTGLAARGAELFRKNCLGCHNMPPFKMSKKGKYIDPDKQFIKIGAINFEHVGTDRQYTEDLLRRTTKTGPLEFSLFARMPVRSPECGPDAPPQARAVVPGGEYFAATVGAITKRGLAELGLTPAEKMAYADYRFCPMEAGDTGPKPYAPPADQATRLKAGPLLGIWATGPFLHNGSVPTVYELLSPPEERSRFFWVGNRELDTEKLGYVSDEKPGLFRFDTSLVGNGNGGHAFPKKRPLTPGERMAVIEFLKSPTALPRKTN